MKKKCFLCNAEKLTKDLEKNTSHSLKPSRVKYIWLCKNKTDCMIKRLEDELKELKILKKQKTEK